MCIFPVQLTTSRIGNLTRLIHTLLYVSTIHTYIHIYTVPGTTEQVSHRRGDTGAVVVLATKIRLENGNDHRMEKKKAMTAVRSKRKLLRWTRNGGNKK